MEQTVNSFEALAPRKRSASSTWIIVILIILLVGLGWWWSKGMGGGLVGTTSDDYQAVFLTNNQVYFGQLTERNDNYAILTDIFYLQVAQPLQPSQPNVNPNINLVKLGSELHGPADRMEINRDQILFIENLKADSQVVQGIEKYKADNKPQ